MDGAEIACGIIIMLGPGFGIRIGAIAAIDAGCWGRGASFRDMAVVVNTLGFSPWPWPWPWPLP
jgi:hypothetical protein